MWDYTDKVKDHFTNPRNVGSIKDPDGVGLVGSLACGDALRLMFKLGPDKRIIDVKYQTFGCASAIASSSALSEMIVGKTLEEAERVTNRDIAEYLGGLPEQKMHCSVMGRDALLAAIENHRTGKKVERQVQEHLVCVCFGISRDEIERVARENKLTTVEEITNYTKAGGGCGGCVGEIQEVLDSLRHEKTPTAPKEEKPVKRLTNIQKIKMIEETLEREVRPALRQDGGDIELVDVDGDNVYVSLRGMCSGCRGARATLSGLVTMKLREFVSPDLVVIEQGEEADENDKGCC